MRTILSAFPSCRVYRETPAPTPAQVRATGQDYTNMVVFCHATSSADVTFRRPREADFLQSSARQAYLMPEHEVMKEAFDLEDVEDVLKGANRERVVRQQAKSARGHWGVMRRVVPARVWELW